MSGNTILTILIIAVIAVVAFITIRNYRKQLKEGCCGAGGDEGPGAKVEPKDMNKEHYPYIADVSIEGMHCENCVRKVENAVNRIDGAWADVDLSTNSAKVLLKDPKLEKQIKMAIANNDFLVTSFTVAEKA